MIIWLTGLSGSGKSTVGKQLQKKLNRKKISNVMIDGDVIRDIYGNDLKFHVADRKKQIKRIQELALFFYKKKKIVIVTALFSNKEILKHNRKLFNDYIEVYLKAGISVLLKRDIKNLYDNAIKGLTKNVVGVDIKWIEPTNPDLIFDQSKNLKPQSIANIILKKISA